MNGRILGKLRLWTIAAALGLAVVLFPFQGAAFAAGFLGAALWAVASFLAVEHLVRQALLPRGGSRNAPAIAGLIAAKFALYGLGFWILKSGLVPPLSCFFGFTLLLVVLVVGALTVQPKLATQATRTAAGNGDGTGTR